jgi:hypothetical protein
MQASTALVLAFRQAGFTLVRRNGHLIWRCPCGHTQLTSPATPGKGRSVDNCKGDIARTLRVCRQPTRECA